MDLMELLTMSSIDVRPQSPSGRLRYSDEEFRTAAGRMHGDPGMSVPPHGSLQRCDGGAFVDLVLWVPDDEADAIRMEREFNSGRSVHSARL